jgi:peptidoglycan/xylan/chitin deacetylase (PgdA/CDA1 family)
MQTALKHLARVGLHKFGGLDAIRNLKRNKFRILTYHRFTCGLFPRAQAALADQCAHLTSAYSPVALSDVGESLIRGTPLPPRAVAVTVDDGYRDFLTDAFPVFQRWKIPVTVFLITDFIDGELWPWWNQVDYAVKRAKLGSVRLSITPGSDVREISLRTSQQRASAIEAICGELKKIPSPNTKAFVRTLPELFEIEVPRQVPPEYAALTWEDARLLAVSGVHFGAHTKTHPVLSQVEDVNVLTQEIAGSKSRIEEMLQLPVSHFSYPNGQLDDLNNTTVKIVDACGFRTAVTTDDGLNDRRVDRYRLRRLAVDPTGQSDYFREQLCGLHSQSDQRRLGYEGS